MTYPKSPTARHLADAIRSSYKSQREIAREAGCTSANSLSMMKAGKSKIPINLIPTLSRTLDIAPSTFLDIALREYHPELHSVLSKHYGNGLSSTQRRLLDVLDEARQITPIALLNAELCDLLVQVLVYANRSLFNPDDMQL